MDKTAVYRNGTSPKKSKELPPHNRDAEEALLGSVLIDQGVLYDIADLQLTGEDFFIINVGWIFEAMLGLHRDGQGIDVVTLGDRLEQQDRLKEVGDTSFLMSLITVTPTATHGSYYAKIVKEHAQRRRYLEVAGTIARLAHN